MSAQNIPRYVIPTAILTIAVVGIMVSISLGQYRWLAESLVSSGATKYEAGQAVVFKRLALTRLDLLADEIASQTNDNPASFAVGTILEHNLLNDADMLGVTYAGTDGVAASAGENVPAARGQPGQEQDGHLALQVDVTRGDLSIGTLLGYFSLASVREESAAFKAALLAQGDDARQSAYLRIGTAAILVIIFGGALVWVFFGGQSKRLRELKSQALKLSEANFGEPLVAQRSDEIGELVQVFNAMRTKLQKTTISRDYVDKMLSGMNEAIVVTDDAGIIKRINDATNRMLEYESDELLGKSISTIVDLDNCGPLRTDFAAGIPGEAVFISKMGKLVPVTYTGSVIDGDSLTEAACIYAAQNNTERRKAEQRIRYLARIDALTKIPNRMQFQHLLQRAIAKGQRSHKSVALFYVDIDHFKELNDTFGHLAGDTTLETVAARLTDSLPKNCVVGRLAGDEFAVIIDELETGISTKDAIGKLARSVLDRLADPFYVQGHEVFMTASMGIATCPQDANNVIDLIRNADAALYHSKHSGGNELSYYVPEMNEAAVERLMTKSRLKRAFERDELLVHYQPKYNILTGEVIGAEALVRWELPDRGIVLPSDFIPIAEETNLIVEIGEWVLDRVCEDFRYWQRSVSSQGRVSVNLSLKQLRQGNFIHRISGILRSYEVSPTSLELEITETTLMENPERTIKLLDELYALGLHLAIDDFGTGYSSLSALQQFPISTLKIDQSFVRDIATNPDDETIVGTIIQMGNSLKMDVVAEGVETEEQLIRLQKMNCTYVQGMLFGQPMSSDNYLELLLAQVEGTDKYRSLFA
jgi:diguanylate cyclase (GGDEF)-like protein/PAS domain S-box-containing protein